MIPRLRCQAWFTCNHCRLAQGLKSQLSAHPLRVAVFNRLPPPMPQVHAGLIMLDQRQAQWIALVDFVFEREVQEAALGGSAR